MNVCASGYLHASAPTSRPSHQVTDNKVTLKSTAVCVKNNRANTKAILGQQDFTADRGSPFKVLHTPAISWPPSVANKICTPTIANSLCYFGFNALGVGCGSNPFINPGTV